MKVIRDESYENFVDAPESDWWSGQRIKRVRAETLKPGGRTELTLFETVNAGRPHPRLRVAMPPAQDPSAPDLAFDGVTAPPNTEALRKMIAAALSENAATLSGDDLAEPDAPAGSPRYWRNSIRGQRLDTFFALVRKRTQAWADSASWSSQQRDQAEGAICELEEEAFAGDIRFDDADTGTYHSFGHDKPFVHYLEKMLESLPAEDGRGFAALPAEMRESLRRQRAQAQAHLDHLMRHKYAYNVIEETDIERTVGGFLLDRESRRVASEVTGTDTLAPGYELLRIDPAADHANAGAWVYRDGDLIRLQDGNAVEVGPELLRRSPREAGQLTFRRASDHSRLRKGIRFDWDGNGYVQAGRIDWVSWAGHCDIKAIMEQLGITLSGTPEAPFVEEHRSDTDHTQRYDRDLLLEMVASVFELGSSYLRADRTGRIQRGVHRFGGARNDSRPDRLQFRGTEPGRGFRWPLSGRKETLRVTRIEWDNERADMGRVFFRNLADVDRTDFAANPRFLTTVESDYNVIDISGARIEAELLVDSFDRQTGYHRQDREATTIDLRAEPDGEPRYFLGTHVQDTTARSLYRVYLDRDLGGVIAELDRYEQTANGWTAKTIPEETVRLPMAAPLTCTLSREMKRDNPAMYQPLLSAAIRRGQNICADTDKKAPVWNGVVTRIDNSKLAQNAEARVERWRVDLRARFGSASLDYMLRRDDRGEPIDYCPVPPDGETTPWPDFLWQDFPDIGTKGVENGAWIINETMVERKIVTVRLDNSVPGGFYVFDDHVKNVFEIIYAAVAGYTHTIVHANKRYGFRDRATWQETIERLGELRDRLSFQE